MSGGKKSRSASRRRSGRRQVSVAEPLEPGQQAQAPGLSLRSYQVGALPLVNRILERMRLEEFFREYLPPDDPRCRFPTAQALLVLVRNVLVSREPVYAVGGWAARFAPDLFNLWDKQVALLHDDRWGRCLTRLFVGTDPEFILAVVRHVIAEFQVSLDELHNDSTTVTFSGAYDEAAEEGLRLGRATHAITWGHNKDHRPDLKQLLYPLTVSHDGSVPVYFTSHSGNVVDDTTHIATWDLLCQLVGGPDFSVCGGLQAGQRGEPGSHRPAWGAFCDRHAAFSRRRRAVPREGAAVPRRGSLGALVRRDRRRGERDRSPVRLRRGGTQL